ncbi:hypothetical protein [Corynebacterium spheniscorum]|uniref:Asp23/Gls24 family envelope stress response protein n=1 Tax=Corynebacterium spheniscorum TaxID=185761 RepID=A0A1I2PPQ4_9CORY|nr:hypothetical protein [Corynebacterium spheniscorum]SFG16007.1 hypothetical protein SAMN05660282_00077 [Corynebacterium spheniscorum]
MAATPEVFTHLRYDPVPLEQAREIVAAVRATPGVADLSSGSFGEVALLYPGARIPGLRVSTIGSEEPRLAVHVSVDLGAAAGAREKPMLADIAEAIRGSVRSVGCTELPIDVVFADAAVPGKEQ